MVIRLLLELQPHVLYPALGTERVVAAFSSDSAEVFAVAVRWNSSNNSS